MKHETLRASPLNGCTFCVMTRALPEYSRKDVSSFTNQATPHGDRASKPRDGRV
ncbi:hypothetical protein [Bradyrhizobium sp. CCBAU 051011]|uniref:hypothetical protein n=1 Tax=Bradyrhizobium sp. CCBAU 051011 TaxID=858422 RepID=UPI00137A3588|nr:hypothetical protein [Bradyrhizobium sp. CCBAU 051011]